MHFSSQVPRQDSIVTFSVGDEWQVLAIADGLSSAKESDVSSSYLLSQLPILFGMVFRDCIDTSPDNWAIILRALDRIIQQFLFDSDSKFDATQRNQCANLYATTLEVLCVSRSTTLDGRSKYIFQRFAGDGTYGRVEDLKDFSHLSASQDPVSHLVLPLPLVEEIPPCVEGTFDAASGIYLMSDGLGDEMTNPSFVEAFTFQLTADGFDRERLWKVGNLAADRKFDDCSFGIIKHLSK
jgi:hypothetical protein